MALIDRGSTASLFISMAGFDVPGPQVKDPATGHSIIIRKATVLRIDVSIPDGQQPQITNETVIAEGFGQRADHDVFLIGPTGLALGPNDTLYVSDALANQIVAIPDASTRTSSAGTGNPVAGGGLLHRPLALTIAPNGQPALRQRHQRPGRRGRSQRRQNPLRAMGRQRPGAKPAR